MEAKNDNSDKDLTLNKERPDEPSIISLAVEYDIEYEDIFLSLNAERRSED